MKRIIKFVIAIGFILFLFQFAVVFFINKHEVNYTISQNNATYTVKEQFQKVKKNHYYNFEVFDQDKNKFIFYYDQDYKKKKKVLSQIESYKEGNIYCIAPVFKDKKIGGIVCRQDSELVSFDYLKRAGFSFLHWEDELKTKGYTVDEADIIAKQENVTLYNHFPENYTMSIWNYHGLYLLKKDHFKNLSILDNDFYENTLGILAGNYYIIANTDQDFFYNRIYIVDLFDESKDFVDLETEISKDSYFLGVVGDDVYIMDRDKKIEYSFNIKSRKLKEVGNKDTNATMYYGGKWEEKNIYTVSDNKEMFQLEERIEKLDSLYHPKLVRESFNKYFFVTEDNTVYYVMKSDLNTKVKLFQDVDMKEVKLVNEHLFFISGADIIMYTLSSGYKKLVTHPELLYNSKNIFDVVKK